MNPRCQQLMHNKHTPKASSLVTFTTQRFLKSFSTRKEWHWGIIFSWRDQVANRGMLKRLASVSNPLDLASPVTLHGQIIHREACDLKIKWSKELLHQLIRKCHKWMKILVAQIKLLHQLARKYHIIGWRY